ncbi:MAG: saccharopine dehydrogenase C-terminal domain-containing protein [Nanoarchaeota archaeon]
MKYDFVVLGATGMQGRIVSKDLLKNGYSVLLCGRDKSRVLHLLKKYKKTGFEYFEVTDKTSTLKTIRNSGSNIVINCVEGDWNDKVLEMCLEAGVHSIDLGSDVPLTQKQFALDSALKKKNLIHITGCGSVPGIGNVMLRYIDSDFDKVDYAEAGFAWDSNIKKFVVPFSMPSILEEFTWPADMIVNHRAVEILPSKTVVRCFHKAVDREKCFNVGHHPETYTFYKFFEDKGVKTTKFFAGFPDHSYDMIAKLVEIGFADEKPINYRGIKIVPMEFLAELVKKIKIPEGYKEVENLWVFVSGKKNGRNKEIKMECIVNTLKGWEDAGSNIDTGMPASIIAQFIKKGIIKSPGSFSPEFIVPPIPFFKELRKRKMIVYKNGERVN